MNDGDFNQSVFVNCPFDEEYEPILQAILFCLISFGLTPRIATERDDAGETRIEKIAELIKSSRFSIHDLSRSQAKEDGEYYRLNMPFELGLDLGCRKFGDGHYTTKRALVLEEQRYRYQASLSDLAGIDIAPHGGKWQVAIRKVRNWLVGLGELEAKPPARVIAEYEDFQEWYYEKQLADGFSDEDIQDYSTPELMQAMLDWVAEGRPRE